MQNLQFRCIHSLRKHVGTVKLAMPGGACNVGEPWAATVARESREEIGLALNPAALRLADVFDNRAVTARRNRAVLDYVRS
ncbi:NUDIX domain-containing protein [Glycomyces sp. YM15]|uniref:NUDIX domain-containing protein n=1 Tax=Glycomyces sp. YM15 TaxID=2800446 RepID=UPI001964D8DC|nr:NUDIX domain-containing protein [Glycomyces sp. YM15]